MEVEVEVSGECVMMHRRCSLDSTLPYLPGGDQGSQEYGIVVAIKMARKNLGCLSYRYLPLHLQDSKQSVFVSF